MEVVTREGCLIPFMFWFRRKNVIRFAKKGVMVDKENYSKTRTTTITVFKV